MILRILTDKGTKFCGKPDKHEYELFLALNDIDHTKTKAKNPQTNGKRRRAGYSLIISDMGDSQEGGTVR